ncbi:MAG: aspartate aminotransferase family protein [Archangium sp.]|nr:aspartate aminotransferase family protein [Archangium sp.]MDP3151617.1 aspartate aminotransferase family protein [Archangium sp.]MDP3569152.1 aspartate aminotransferase family protein [Archangium sp.]
MAKTLPKTGTPREAVMQQLKALHTDDAKWKDGRTFSLVYFAGDEVSQLLKDAYGEFIAENGLSPVAFPSLRQMECEVVSMAADLLGGNEDVSGTMTSGGTESIMMAIKTAREWGKKIKGIKRPHIIVPASAHPAFDKAVHYFDVDYSHAPLLPDFRVDVVAMEKLIRPETVLLVGSAPSYPHGVIDDITAIAGLAKSRGMLCHVDACLGGFFLPFARKLGRAIAPFDFAVDGVTSMSADLHKYGYAAKGASVVLYRSGGLRRHQFFTYAGWNGGLYASPSFCGTRPGGAIAAAWAVMHHLGEEGYLTRAQSILDSTKKMQEGIRKIPGLAVLAEPVGGVFAFGSDSINVYELGDAMDARGWKLDRQMNPPALHVMVTPAHAAVLEQFLKDLTECAKSLTAGEPAPDGSAAMYGMVGTIPDRQQVDDFLVDFLDGLFNRA